MKLEMILTLLLITSPAFAGSSVLENMFNASESIVTVQSTARGLVKDEGLKIIRYGSIAAGIVIDKSGLIVTNAHTVRVQAAQIKITLSTGETFPGELIRAVPEHDIAFIRIDPGKLLPAMELADSGVFGLNATVYTIGTSSVSKDTFSQGKITGLVSKKGSNQKSAPAEMFKINFNAYKGDSGSPVMDKNGRLLGILSTTDRATDKSSFAVPSNIIRQYRDKITSPQ